MLFLNEAFDSPVEFHLTDDTKIPQRIFGAYNYDNQDYGMSLEETTYPKVYALQLYKINSKKPRIWAFKGVKDIMVGFATLIKFAEMATPLVKMRMDGIMIRIPVKAAASKYQRFAVRLLRKSYIKSFSVVPVDQSGDQESGYNYLFLIRKGASVSTVFGSKPFAKFNLKDNQPTGESLDPVENKWPKKQIVKTEPSKKYTLTHDRLGSLGAIDIVHGDEDLVKATFANPVSKDTTPSPDVDSSGLTDEDKKILDEFNGYFVRRNIGFWLINKIFGGFTIQFDNFYSNYQTETDRYLEIKKLLDPRFFDAIADIVTATNGYKKEDIYEVRYALNYALASAKQYSEIDDAELAHKINLTTKTIEIFRTKAKEAREYLYGGYNTSSKYHEPDIHLEIPVNIPEVTIPGSGEDNTERLNTDFYGHLEKDEDVKAKKHYIMHNLGYHDKIGKLPGISAIKAYTGSDYSDLNGYFRYQVSKPDQANYYEYKAKSANLMARAFDKIEPLPEGIWVYRATHIPEEIKLEVPGEFIDPGFMSTSIKSSNRFGLGNTIMKIYLPKGSRVIPVLDHSKNSSEMEVILPPFSVLRNVELITFKNDKIKFVKQIFVGSAYKSWNEYTKKPKQVVEEGWNMMEAIKQAAKEPKYDPNAKYGSVNDPETFKKLSELLKSGKLKPSK